LDVAARKAKMQKVEKILQTRPVVVQPMWAPGFHSCFSQGPWLQRPSGATDAAHEGLDQLTRVNPWAISSSGE